MKKILSAVALAMFAVFAMGACSNEPPPPSKAQIYTDYVRDHADVPSGVTNRDLIDAGHGFCNMLDEGYTPREIFLSIATEFPEADPSYIGTVAGAAVATFCPEHGDQIS